MAETTIKDVNLKIGTESQFQSKLKDLPINTLVGTTDPIQESELDSAIINKLTKAENALPKPTNDSTGSENDVLSKTANGSEWKTIITLPSGGNPGEVLGCSVAGTPQWVPEVKIYKHYMTFNTSGNEKVTLTKISTESNSFSNIAEAYSNEIDFLGSIGDQDAPIPVVGTIESNSQKFSAIAIGGSTNILYGEGNTTIDISDLTDWIDYPFKI